MLSPSGEAAAAQETGASVCMVVPSLAAAPFGLHLSAPAQATPWLQPLPRHCLLSFLLLIQPGLFFLFLLLLWPFFSFSQCLPALLCGSHRGATGSPEDGLGHSLPWVCWSWLELAVTSSGQPLTEATPAVPSQ